MMDAFEEEEEEDDLDEDYEDLDVVDDDEEDEEDDIMGKGKRRATDDNNKGTPKKKKLSAVNPGIDEIVDDLDHRRKKKKGRRGPRPKLTPELARKMGEANMAYVNRQHAEAVALLKEVVKHAPNVADPYHTLGLIYEDIGDKQNSLNFFMIAAHVTPNDALLWKRLALMSRELGNPTQAIYCYTKAIKLDVDDLDSLWDRSVIYAEQGDTKKAIEGFLYLSERRPDNTEVVKELARVYSQSGHPEKAIELLEDKMDKGMDDLNIANILCELLITKGDYQKGVDLITKIGRAHGGESALPIDLRINQGICHIYLRNIELSERYLDLLFHKDVKVYDDLYYNLAEAYMSVGETEKALRLYQALNESPTYNHPLIWLKQGTCLRLLRQIPEAVAVFEAVIEKAPGHTDAVLALSEMYKELGMTSKALVLLEHHTAQGAFDTPAPQTLEHITLPDTVPTGASDLRVLVEKGLILFGLGKYKEFLDACLPIFSVAVPKRTEKKRGRRPSEWKRQLKENNNNDNTNSFFELTGKKKSRRKPQEEAGTTAPTETSQQIPPTDASAASSSALIVIPGQEPHLPLDTPEITSMDTNNNGNNITSVPLVAAPADSIITDVPHPAPEATSLANIPMETDASFAPIEETEEARKARDAQEAKKQQQEQRKQKQEERQREREKIRKRRERKAQRKKMLNNGKRERRKRYGRGSYLAEILGEDQYFDVVMKTCKVLAYFDRYAEAADIIQDALTNVNFTDKANKVPPLRFLAVGIAFNNDDFVSAFDSVKYVCTQRPYSIPIWNLYNKMMTKAGTFTANNKFMTRLLLKHGSSVPLMVLVGHECFISGSFRLALGEYLMAYDLMPDEPILSLCIGLSYLHQVMNRRLADRHYTAMQAFTFLFKYFELQKKNQESCYNIGRAFHHLGLKHLAVPFYERALKISDESGGSLPEEHDLKREIAYNLSLIYNQSGSHHLARQVLTKYVTI